MADPLLDLGVPVALPALPVGLDLEIDDDTDGLALFSRRAGIAFGSVNGIVRLFVKGFGGNWRV